MELKLLKLVFKARVSSKVWPRSACDSDTAEVITVIKIAEELLGDVISHLHASYILGTAAECNLKNGLHYMVHMILTLIWY